MCRLCTLLECGKVFRLGDGTEVKIRLVFCRVPPPPKANCHPELQAPSVEAVAGSIGYVHVPGEVLTLHAFATQDYVFSCVSGCACCVDV